MRPPANRPISLRRSLQLLVIICIAPMAALLAANAYETYQLHQQKVYSETQRLADNIVAEIDREFTGIESGLRILATSDALKTGDFAQFYQIAKSAVHSQIVYNYVLTNEEGHQVINTFKPYGANLPRTGTPPQLAAVFSKNQTVLTDFFIGPVTGKPAIAMGVPVTSTDGDVIFSLNIGLYPERLSQILKKQLHEDEWLAALIDTSGTIVGRTRNEDQFIGKPVVPELLNAIRNNQNGTLLTTTKEGDEVVTAYATSKLWNWSVAVGAPKNVLEKRLRDSASLLFLFTLGVLLLASLIVFTIIRRLTYSVEALNAAATAMQHGQPVELPDIRLTEAEAIAHSIVHASKLASEVHFRAYHDPLTGLANRQLFYEFLENSMARAQRTGEAFSLLLLDIDHFKEVNDTHGHGAGDALLRIVSERISGETRSSDLAARIGGDEFAVLLSDSNKQSALEVAGRLRQSLASPYPDIEQAVSASIGIVTWHPTLTDSSVMIELADKAMYEVKSHGRNGIREAVLPKVDL